jgi:hypothetical protein
VPLTAPLFGVIFFTGAYLPQKSDLLPPLERERKPFQKHVPSYYMKLSEGCFLWAAPTQLRGRPYSINADNSLRGANTTEYRCRIEPGSCIIIARSGARLIFKYSNMYQLPLSTEAHFVLVQINTALNREGVELPFNQYYRFELTTNPLGKHYIIS